MTEPPQPPDRPDESPWNAPPPGPGGQFPPPGPGYPPPEPGGPQYRPPGPWGPQQPGPQYPPPGPPGYGGYPGAAPPRGPGLFARLGSRALRRPEPRQTISLAGSGVVLVLAGVVIWAGGYFVDGLNNGTFDTDTGRAHFDDSRRFLGAGLSFLVAIAGYALVILRRQGPLATAGVLAGAIGVPLAIGWVSLDLSGAVRGDQVINIDAVFLISIVVWVISYLGVPGARGRAFYLGLAAYYLASYCAFKAAGNQVVSFAVSATGSTSTRTGGLGSVAAIGLVFGLGYYLAALLLDRAGRPGVAVGFVVAGFFATAGGISAGVPTFHQIGTGVVLIVLGLALGWYGGRYGRRFTTWTWTAAVVLGIVLIVADLVPDSAAGAGITLIVLGIAVVAAAEFLVRALREPPDLPAVAEEAAPAGAGSSH